MCCVCNQHDFKPFYSALCQLSIQYFYVLQKQVVSLVKVFEINFGNMFQEYDMTFDKRKEASGKLHLLWVFITMILSMSFVGNLKSILMKKDFEPMASTKAEIVDMDMKILVRYGMEPILEMYASVNDIDNRLLCQARKSNGFYKAG